MLWKNKQLVYRLGGTSLVLLLLVGLIRMNPPSNSQTSTTEGITPEEPVGETLSVEDAITPQPTQVEVNSNDLLKEEDLEKELDLGAMGKNTVVHIISSFLIGHTDQLAGELSALKGVHGSKGYPF